MIRLAKGVMLIFCNPEPPKKSPLFAIIITRIPHGLKTFGHIPGILNSIGIGFHALIRSIENVLYVSVFSFYLMAPVLLRDL